MSTFWVYIYIFICTSFAGIGLSGVSLSNCFDKTKFLLCNRGWETTFDENKALNRTGKGENLFDLQEKIISTSDSLKKDQI